MSKYRKIPTQNLFAPQNTHDDPHFEWPDQDLEHSDYVLEVMERTEQSKPRLLSLKDWDSAFVRLVDRRLDAARHAERGASREHEKAAARLVTGLTEIKTLRGPSTEHAIDEMAARLLAEAQNFGPVIEAIRRGAQASIRGGARWLQFKPILIESPPGLGKTRFAQLLAEASHLALVYLDCALMTTTGSLISHDSVWRTSRASDVIEALSNGPTANLLVVVDEFDKLVDHSRGGPLNATEKMVGLLEPRGARAYLDPFLQLNVDLSFINWVLICNDLNRIAKPVRDRCIVVNLGALTPHDIAVIAEAEIARRGLAPQLAVPLVRAAKSGKLTSLRKLHKALDAAAAAASRPLLH
jgi:hypothetical protein